MSEFGFSFGESEFRSPAVAAESSGSAIVAGAGTAAVNGTYTERGNASGKPFYNLFGQPDDQAVFAIVWQDGAWLIYGGSSEILYGSLDDVAFPWMAIWIEGEGLPPAPTVTEG